MLVTRMSAILSINITSMAMYAHIGAEDYTLFANNI